MHLLFLLCGQNISMTSGTETQVASVIQYMGIKDHRQRLCCNSHIQNSLDRIRAASMVAIATAISAIQSTGVSSTRHIFLGKKNAPYSYACYAGKTGCSYHGSFEHRAT